MDRKLKAAALSALSTAPDYHLHASELSTAATDAGASIEGVRVALAARSDLPRALTENEEAALRSVIETNGVGDASALLAQVPHTQVVGYCGCGCATIDLAVSASDAKRSEAPDSPLSDVSVVDAEGEIVGGLILFTTSGYVATLELFDYGDGPIPRMPGPESLVFDSSQINRR